MSSHHIVRDEQEPALLAPNARWLRNETLASLLEWSPTIVVPAGEVEVLTTLGIKPDVVVATHEEKIQHAVAWEAFAPLTILERTSEQPAVIAALHYLLANKYKAVNIFSSPFDLSLSEFALFFANMDIVFYSETSRWLWIRQGKYSKWLPAGTQLSVKSLDEPQEFIWAGFTAKPAQNPLNGAILEVEKDEMVSISSNFPFLLEEQL
jgi:thiamine pyrophosphokinase